jgi:hypothetical protein
MPLCRQQFAADPSSVSPVSVAVIFMQHGANPSLECVSKPMPFGAFVISCEVLSEACTIYRKVQV